MRDIGERRDARWGRLKAFIGVVTVAFVVTLALIVGNRLSDEALGVLAGAVCGVGAAIPTSLIIVAVTRRRDDSQPRTAPAPHRNSYPPVVVVSPQSERRRSADWNSPPSSVTAPRERRFTVVGGASLGDEETHRGREERS